MAEAKRAVSSPFIRVTIRTAQRHSNTGQARRSLGDKQVIVSPSGGYHKKVELPHKLFIFNGNTLDIMKSSGKNRKNKEETI